MTILALVHGNAVVQVAAVEFPVVPELVWVDASAVADVAAGWTYDGTTFAAPAAPPAPPNPVTISTEDYFKRFQLAETAAVHTAALAQPVTTQSLTLFNYLLLAAANGTVTLTDPVMTDGHAALVQLGLLTAVRSAFILTP